LETVEHVIDSVAGLEVGVRAAFLTAVADLVEEFTSALLDLEMPISTGVLANEPIVTVVDRLREAAAGRMGDGRGHDATNARPNPPIPKTFDVDGQKRA
jgi:hypothetical protein